MNDRTLIAILDDVVTEADGAFVRGHYEFEGKKHAFGFLFPPDAPLVLVKWLQQAAAQLKAVSRADSVVFTTDSGA